MSCCCDGTCRHAVSRNKPFYIQLNPVAPHDQGTGKVAVPAPRHADLFSDVRMPVVSGGCGCDRGSGGAGEQTFICQIHMDSYLTVNVAQDGMAC